ncbi:tyrosine-type recombinase/integrase [Ktedonobacter sp. SOSP1-52]|uniref:tyrosine-type recombinase/integrase n=1 Tax=Ktedonobacter sp. SOSP1-52 TaxID=2778366 RepID=UPI001F38F96C|nr:tyrosine-type recombinase/integrase [Ktedonobacter sp. SOSP1-52]
MSTPASFHACQYLFFLVLHGHIRFDWEWLIAIERLETWDFLRVAGIEVNLAPILSLATKLGYSQASICFASQWSLGRLFLHTGQLPVEQFSENDLAEFAEAIRQFGERPDVALFYGSLDHYRKRAQAYLGMLYRLHLVLYHQCHAKQLPRRTPRKRVYPPLHKPRMEAVVARYLTARRLTDRPSTVKSFALALHRFIRWIEQAYPTLETFAEVTRDHVLQFAEEFDTLVHPKTKRPPGAGSKLVMLGRLAVFFQDVACWGWEDVPLHPLLQGRDLPRRPKSIPRYIPDDELARLMTAIRALECPYQKTALLIARWSGARRGEIQRLDVNCLDRYPDGTDRLRIPAGKTKKERVIPLNEEAAQAIRALQQDRQGDWSFRDELTGMMTRYLFVRQGKWLSVNYLFDTPLKEACSVAGLVTENGKPLVSAHRFRHTVGTQLAERGAKLHTIMKILGHDSAQMSVIYAQISDQTVLQDYQAVLGPQAKIAGSAAKPLRSGEFTPTELSWLQTNYFKAELELGRCLRLPQEGPCECELYLTCAKFVTTPEYAPRLRRRRRIEQELVEDSLARGWQREVERHQCTIRRLEQLLHTEMDPILSYTLNLFADYHQFYLQDELTETDTPDDWGEQLTTHMIAVDPGIVGVGTARNLTVPVRVDLLVTRPVDDFDVWDHVAEASLEVPCGQIVIAGCSDYFPVTSARTKVLLRSADLSAAYLRRATPSSHLVSRSLHLRTPPLSWSAWSTARWSRRRAPRQSVGHPGDSTSGLALSACSRSPGCQHASCHWDR